MDILWISHTTYNINMHALKKFTIKILPVEDFIFKLIAKWLWNCRLKGKVM